MNDSPWANLNRCVLLAVGRSSANNRHCWTVSARAWRVTTWSILSRTVQSALQHPSSGPPQKFADRGALGRSTIDAASRAPGLRGCNGSIGDLWSTMSGRLKFKSKSCHGTAARPVKAEPHTVGLRGCGVQRLSLLPDRPAPRYPPSVTGHSLLPLRSVVMVRLGDRQMSNVSRGG